METIPGRKSKILLVYGSWQGSSKDISNRICRILDNEHVLVQCADVNKVPDPSQYDAVILGGGIRGGCFHPKLIRFVQQNHRLLSKMPVAFFVVCLTLKKNNETNRCAASEYLKILKQKAPDLEPVSVGLFGGVMDYAGFSPLMRMMVKLLKMPQGDYRDWHAIEQWAAKTGNLLLASLKAIQPDNPAAAHQE